MNIDWLSDAELIAVFVASGMAVIATLITWAAKVETRAYREKEREKKAASD